MCGTSVIYYLLTVVELTSRNSFCVGPSLRNLLHTELSIAYFYSRDFFSL